MPFSIAACRTVLPFSTVTCRPSIVSVTVSINTKNTTINAELAEHAENRWLCGFRRAGVVIRYGRTGGRRVCSDADGGWRARDQGGRSRRRCARPARHLGDARQPDAGARPHWHARDPFVSARRHPIHHGVRAVRAPGRTTGCGDLPSVNAHADHEEMQPRNHETTKTRRTSCTRKHSSWLRAFVVALVNQGHGA